MSKGKGGKQQRNAAFQRTNTWLYLLIAQTRGGWLVGIRRNPAQSGAIWCNQAMAARVEHCHCGRPSTEFKSVRGFQTHRGMCKEVGRELAPPIAAGGAMQDQPEAAEALVADAEDDDAHAMDISADGDGVVPDDDAAATYVLGSATDDMIGRLYMKHPSMTVSLLEDILRIARSGPATASRAEKLFDRIDALPGMPVVCVIQLNLCVVVTAISLLLADLLQG